jgi:hypothetical protein
LYRNKLKEKKEMDRKKEKVTNWRMYEEGEE